MVDVTRPILSASYLYDNGIEPHLARRLFLKHGERHEPLIKKSGVYFVKAQIVHEVNGAVEAVMQHTSQHMSCVRTDGLQNSHKSCVSAEGLHKCLELCVVFEKHNSSKRNGAVVQPVVKDTIEDDNIPSEAGAGMIPAPCEPSEMKVLRGRIAEHSWSEENLRAVVETP